MSVGAPREKSFDFTYNKERSGVESYMRAQLAPNHSIEDARVLHMRPTSGKLANRVHEADICHRRLYASMQAVISISPSVCPFVGLLRTLLACDNLSQR